MSTKVTKRAAKELTTIGAAAGTSTTARVSGAACLGAASKNDSKNGSTQTNKRKAVCAIRSNLEKLRLAAIHR